MVVVGNAIFTLLIVLSIAAAAVLFIGRQRFEAPGPLAEDKMVNIPRGLGIRDIADLLQREGVIDQPYVFMGGVIALKARGELKYGEYQFTKNSSVADVVDTITEGKVIQHAVTVPEGLTSEQIVARLLENDGLAGQIQRNSARRHASSETYRFTRGMTREQIIQRMQQAHRRVLQEVWERRMQYLPGQDAEQLVTLASIVEKETGRPDERTRFAAVFVNRLKSRIQTAGSGSNQCRLRADRRQRSRLDVRSSRARSSRPRTFNTYVVDGLPPVQLQIRAVLHLKRRLILLARRNSILLLTVPAAASFRKILQTQKNVAAGTVSNKIRVPSDRTPCWWCAKPLLCRSRDRSAWLGDCLFMA